MASIEERKARVANGSRRQRDLAAAGIDAQLGKSRHRLESEAWIAANLPGEIYHAVGAITYRLKKQGQPITAESVREGLRERGWLKEQNS